MVAARYSMIAKVSATLDTVFCSDYSQTDCSVGLLRWTPPLDSSLGLLPRTPPSDSSLGLLPRTPPSESSLGVLPRTPPSDSSLGLLPRTPPSDSSLGLLPRTPPSDSSLGLLPRTPSMDSIDGLCRTPPSDPVGLLQSPMWCSLEKEGEPSVHLQRNDQVMVGWGEIQPSIPPEEGDSIGNYWEEHRKSPMWCSLE